MNHIATLQHTLKCHELTKSDFVSADNCSLTDSHGNTYIDFEAGTWCTVLGYKHPQILDAIKSQVDALIHCNHRFTTDLTDKVAARILNLLGMDDGKCIFLTSGSEAVTFGLETARIVSGKSNILVLQQAFLAAYGEAREQNTENWLKFDWSKCQECLEKEPCKTVCSRFQSIDFKQIAAFVFEPGNSSGLANCPPLKLVKNLEQETQSNNGLIVVDEITTGFGRTGKWFGFQHYGMKPDIVAMGKGLGNGYPVSCVAVTGSVADQFEESRYHYAQSHSNEPLGCAVANEVISVLLETQAIEKSTALSRYFFDKLYSLQKDFAVISDIRGRGLMIVMEFQKEAQGINAKELANHLFEQGLLVGTNPTHNILRFYPALTISTQQIDRLIFELRNFLQHEMKLGE